MTKKVRDGTVDVVVDFNLSSCFADDDEDDFEDALDDDGKC